MDKRDPPQEPPETESTAQLDPAADQELLELVRRAISGNKVARQQLCERHLPLFQQIAAKLTYRFAKVTPETARQEAMDILHHIVCAFMAELQEADGIVARWRPERGALAAWLRPFATCRGLDYLRKRKSGRYLSLEEMKGAIESGFLELYDPSQLAMGRVEYQEALHKLCAHILNTPTLGADALQLLERIFWHEEDRELVARSMGLKRNTLDARIKRLRDTLLELSKELGLPFGKSGPTRSGD